EEREGGGAWAARVRALNALIQSQVYYQWNYGPAETTANDTMRRGSGKSDRGLALLSSLPRRLERDHRRCRRRVERLGPRRQRNRHADIRGVLKRRGQPARLGAHDDRDGPGEIARVR